jgi:hypothetical protein
MARLWDWVDGIPDYRHGGGVYALYRGKELVYIGHTGNFRSRIQCHRRRFAFDGIKLAPIESRRERQRLERRLLFRLTPFENRIIPTTSCWWWDR